MDKDDVILPLLLAIDPKYYFELLVTTHARELFNYALHRANNHPEAEDILQETLLNAYLALDRYPKERIRALYIRPWLFKIMERVCLNHYNRYRKGKLQEVSIHDLIDTFSEVEIDPLDLPENVVESAERKQKARLLVSTLPYPYREAIYYFYFEDWSHQELARFLNKPVSTVKSYLFRGRSLLRSALQDANNEGQ